MVMPVLRELSMFCFRTLKFRLIRVTNSHSAPEEGGCVHNISQAKLLFFRPATKVSAACCIHREDRMPLAGTGETVSVPAFPRSNIDLEILAPSNTRIAFKIPNYDLS